MSVTANGKPRTVKKFTMEVRLLKDGKAQEPPAYVADSERTIGDFLYRYSKDSVNSLGYAVEKDIYEEMPDLASDVYSLGVLLYELLTGVNPFAASGLQTHEILRRICEEEPEKPSELVSRVCCVRRCGTWQSRICVVNSTISY